MICGCMLLVAPEIVRAEIPPAERGPGRSPTENKVLAHSLVIRYYDSIIQPRKFGASWDTVAHLLRQAGHRVSQNTIHKYFLIEQDRRCEHETKEKAAAAAAA